MLCAATTHWRPTRAPAAGSRRAARQQARCLEAVSSSQPAAAADAHTQQQQQQQQLTALPRRAALASALAAAAAPWLLSGAAYADNAAVQAGLNRYVKKKKLERLDTYVPPLLEARNQLVRVGRVMLQDPAAARQLLRSGVFAGLRDNVRSLGEHASEMAGDDSGRELVKGFFGELEGLDGALRQAVRGDEGLPSAARERLDGTIAALDRLLATVPQQDMQRAQEIVEEVGRLDAEADAEGEGAEATLAGQLEKLL